MYEIESKRTVTAISIHIVSSMRNKHYLDSKHRIYIFIAENVSISCHILEKQILPMRMPDSEFSLT